MNIKRTIITTIVALALVAVVAPAVTQADQLSDLMALVTSLQAQIAQLQGGAPAVGTGACAGVNFQRTLVVGSTGSDVKCLQTILNQSATTQVSATGAGSPGLETTYFGPKTLVAVRKYQVAQGFTPANQVGPMTRAALNAAIGTVGGVVPPPPGAMSAMLAADNPAAGTLVVGQGLTTLAKFQLNGSGTVTSITLKRIGVSADSTLSNVYLFDGATRITDSGSVSGGSLVTFSGLNISVAGSKVISVKSTIENRVGASGEQVGVQLTAVASSATVTGLPVSANLFGISSATLAAVSLSIALPSTPATTDPQTDVRIWESTVNVGTRDVTLTRLALRQINSIASTDISNFRLLIDGVQVAQVQNLDADKYVTFNFSKTLTTGNRNVKVLADVIGGSSFYIQMSLRTTADIELTDSQYGVNITPTSGVPATTDTLQVNAGTMTVEKATDSPSGNITNAANDAVLGRFTFKANGEPIKVETLIAKFTFNGAPGVINDAAATLRNGKIVVNGSQVGSTTTLVAGGTSFSANFIVTPGSPATVEIRADVFDNDGVDAIDSGDTIAVSLGQGSSNAEKRVSYGRLSVPGADVPANQVTVAQGTIVLAKQSNYANQNTVIPQTAYKLAAFNLNGNNTEDVSINTISVDFTTVTGTTFTAIDLSNVYLQYGTNTTTTKSTVSASGNSWSLNNFTLAKNATVPIIIYATIGSAITPNASIRATTTISGLTSSSGQSVDTGAVPGQEIIAKTGSFTGTVNSGSTAVTAIVSDNNTIQAADFKFTAVNDTYKITKLTFAITGADASAVNNVVLKDGTTVLGTLPGAAQVVFNLPTSGAGSAVVNPSISGGVKTLTVALELGTIGAGAGGSGSNVGITLNAASNAIASSTGIEAAISTGVTAANNLYAYAAIPTITILPLPSTGLAVGATNTVAKFQISSGGSGTVAWNKIILNVAKSSSPTVANASTVSLWNADSGTQIPCSNGGANYGVAAGLTGGATTTGTMTCVTTTEEEITGARTYLVKAIVGGSATINTDFISTNIASGASIGYVAPNDYTTVAGTNATFVWSDYSAQSHDTTTSDWNNDYLVKNIPTDAQRISY